MFASKYLEEVRTSLKYNPISGELHWRDSGKLAGHIDLSRGYLRVRFRGRLRSGSRLCWFLYYGVYPSPDLQIDHINGNRSDNLISNLRLVNARQNATNAVSHRVRGRLPGTNRSGNRWMARATIRGNRVYLGTYETEEQAHHAYVDFVNVNGL